MNRATETQRQQALERQYEQKLARLPKSTRRIVKVGLIKFAKPKFWDDNAKVVKVTNILKLLSLTSWVTTLILLMLALNLNDKKTDWKVYSFDRDGVVRLIQNLRKVY